MGRTKGAKNVKNLKGVKQDNGYIRLSKTRALTPSGELVTTNSKVKTVGGPEGNKPLYANIEDFKQDLLTYSTYIQDIAYTEVPTYLNISRYLNISYSSIVRYINSTEPTKKLWENLQADLISSGAMLGKYKEVSSIFTLKNRCSWSDKREVTTNSNSNSKISQEQADKLIEDYLKSRQV